MAPNNPEMLKMTPINLKSAQNKYSKKWHVPIHRHMKVTYSLIRLNSFDIKCGIW